MPAIPIDPAWDVAALVLAAGDALAARFGAVAVRGELSGFTRAASGHCYFSLKDRTGQPALLRCAMFRRAASLLSFVPRDGQQVEVRGRIAVFEARGELQCVVEAMTPLGQGALYEQFLRLKAQLAAQGLFAPERKRPIPRWPSRIGVVSSMAAAALADVLTALRRRAPHVGVVVYPSAVQGADAPVQLVRALALANQRAEVDVLLLCRGGGSLEDLWSFNDERVVRAVVESVLPVVCGVGHETDVTLADLAADLRAATPTAAAELAAPHRDEALATLGGIAARRKMAAWRRLDAAAQRLDRTELRMGQPMQRVERERARVAQWAARLDRVSARLVPQQRGRLDGLAARRAALLQTLLQGQMVRLDHLAHRIEQLHPRQVLARGFAWIESSGGKVLTSVGEMGLGDTVRLQLADGSADAQVQALRPHAAGRTG